MSKIKLIRAQEILNAKGIPTVEAVVYLDDGLMATASSPSGTSVGTYEALDLRDNDEKRFKGQGVLQAVKNVESIIAPKLIGKDSTDQADIDKTLISLDGTDNKAKLGANATLAVSMAICKVGAKSVNTPLYLYIRQFIKNNTLPLKIPAPLFNVINGGQHAAGNVDFQEYLLIPATSKSYQEALQIGLTIYRSIAEILLAAGLSTLVGDEGGFGPKLAKNDQGFQLLKDAVDRTNLRFGFDVFFGLDAASNSFRSAKDYKLRDRSVPYTPDDLIRYYQELNNTFHLLYIEDPLSEDDWQSWAKLNSVITNAIVVGDDLTATNPFRLQKALDTHSIGGIIIKPNQIGTVMEALAVVEIARSANLKIIVSHRSGETNEDFLADFAVGVNADYVKFGAPQRGERIAKYNRLIYIDKQLQNAGKTI